MSKKSIFFVLLFIIFFIPACVFMTGFQKKGDTYVYSEAGKLGYKEYPIPGIDAESFQILNRHGYAKDDLQVYYQQNIVEDADPESFAELSDLYGRDNTHVFYKYTIIPGADPATFELFDIDWGRDAQDIYRQNVPLEACDPATFEMLREDWQRDSQCAYRNGAKLPNADPSSFVVVNFWFAKDKTSVYYSNLGIVEGADPATFKIREGECEVCAEDKNACYLNKERVDCKSSP